ncbi:response regulator [Alkalicoccobacillus plakortidis]|uniref:Response regulator n=1 Tax=Alkalicoccobacillus plakortidis TaxID=444060 RepID=A0ABT0XHH5_9BACI|nr:response regulator [Alkalicoccobacillus plakortidis]MCM2675361.1 response regulator [Alkalicoccobacillus plakortidis]
MYSVLLVDDEVNILEGIAALVNWNSCGAELIGKAGNGIAALEQIHQKHPDIVITDIKMPGLTGIELIKKAHQEYPQIKWIILSGHDEFDYAQTAMEHEVKHYLLKPSNETKIEEALSQITSHLDKQKQDENFVINMKEKLNEILPKARTQVLKEVLSDNTFGSQEWEHFQHLFGSDDIVAPLKLIVFMIDEPIDSSVTYRSDEFEHFYALKEIATSELKRTQSVLLSTTIGEKVVILIESCPDQELISILKEVKQHFYYFYQLSFTSAVSSENTVIHLRQLYREALQGLAERFYLEEGGIISTGLIDKQPFRFDELQFNHEELLVFIRSGNQNEVNQYLNHYFSYVTEKKYDVSIVKAHSLELYTSIIRQASNELMNELFTEIVYFQRLDSFKQMEDFIKEAAQKVVNENYTSTKKHLSTTIHNLCEYVNSYYSDSELSLTQLSNDVFYMNPDYLGKLFKKEIGEKFSHYLMKLRITKAIDLICESEHARVADIAEMVGFGSNPRYFSQVFKKQTGYTPREYKENDCLDGSRNK